MALARREKIHFETLEDLVSQTEYKWGYVSGTYLDSVLQVIWLVPNSSLYSFILLKSIFFLLALIFYCSNICRNQTLKFTRRSTKGRVNLRQRIKRCYPSAVTFTSGNWWLRSTCLSPLFHICRRSVSLTAAPCCPPRDSWRTTVHLAFPRIHRSKRYSLSSKLNVTITVKI